MGYPDTTSQTQVNPRHVSSRQDFMQAVKDTFPLAVSAFAYGIAYGALAHTTNHLSLLQTLAMSLFVFAGASQFTVLALLHQGATALTIIGSAFLLNARQILYGLSLGRHMFQVKRRHLPWLAHGLTDESYSVSIIHAQTTPVTSHYFAGAGSTIFFSWIASSGIGFVLGSFIGDPSRIGLDFAYIGAFLGLLIAQLRNIQRLGATIFAAIAAVTAAHSFGTSGAVLAGALAAFIYGVVQKHES